MNESNHRATVVSRHRKLAVIGSGPRALSVLERFAARAIEAPIPVELYLFDAVEVGCGRIWRTEQPSWFLMNTVAGEISAFSGPPDSGPARPGSGPSFAQWWEISSPGDGDRSNHYAPRNVYGRYLQYVLDVIERALPSSVRVHRVTATVEDIEKVDEVYRVRFGGGLSVEVDGATIATGHARPDLTGDLLELRKFSESRTHLNFIAGDSSADMELDRIDSGSKVGVIGMGLTFFDVISSLTLGRGGQFIESGAELEYIASGKEPAIVAGSRSGFPQPARGRNQKPPGYSYRPVFFTEAQVRADAHTARVDFRKHAAPRLTAEVNLVYLTAILRRRHSDAVAIQFDHSVRAAGGSDIGVLLDLAARFGVDDVELLDFDVLALPFSNHQYGNRIEFDQALTAAIEGDLHQAQEGNVDSPIKAGLDILRSLRWIIRDISDFGGLEARSHRYDLVDWYSQRSSFLAAGPPLIRSKQVLALIEAGVLRIIGPQARFEVDRRQGRFLVSSPRVKDSAVTVDTIIDARIPAPDLLHDSSPLTRSLRDRGILTEFVNRDSTFAFHTGGVAVTRSPFHPVGADGEPDRGLFVLGIPSEFSRFFTQVVATGPTSWSEFMRDADDVAAQLHSLATAGRTQPVSVGG